VDGFVVHEVAADVEVRILRAMPELSPDMELQMERLWLATPRPGAWTPAPRMTMAWSVCVAS
jgi:hypothetical protein